MIKRVAIFVLLLSLFANLAFAELDVSSLTDDELKAIISQCSAELRSRHTTQEDGVLLFDQGGMRLYQTGEAEINPRGRINIPVMVCNDLEISASLNLVSVVCNGFAVNGYCGSTIPPQSKAKNTLDFSTEDVGLTSVEDIESLIFGWEIYSIEKPGVVLGPTEREEHRFW